LNFFLCFGTCFDNWRIFQYFIFDFGFFFFNVGSFFCTFRCSFYCTLFFGWRLLRVIRLLNFDRNNVIFTVFFVILRRCVFLNNNISCSSSDSEFLWL
jgi:hypothetical protein